MLHFKKLVKNYLLETIDETPASSNITPNLEIPALSLQAASVNFFF